MSSEHPTEEQLVAAALGELDKTPDGLRIEQHLAACPRCRDEVRELGGLLDAARSDHLPELPANGLAQLQAAQAAAQAHRPVRRTAPLPLLMAASIALVMFVSGFWSGHLAATRHDGEYLDSTGRLLQGELPNLPVLQFSVARAESLPTVAPPDSGS